VRKSATDFEMPHVRSTWSTPVVKVALATDPLWPCDNASAYGTAVRAIRGRNRPAVLFKAADGEAVGSSVWCRKAGTVPGKFCGGDFGFRRLATKAASTIPGALSIAIMVTGNC